MTTTLANETSDAPANGTDFVLLAARCIVCAWVLLLSRLAYAFIMGAIYDWERGNKVDAIEDMSVFVITLVTSVIMCWFLLARRGSTPISTDMRDGLELLGTVLLGPSFVFFAAGIVLHPVFNQYGRRDTIVNRFMSATSMPINSFMACLCALVGLQIFLWTLRRSVGYVYRKCKSEPTQHTK